MKFNILPISKNMLIKFNFDIRYKLLVLHSTKYVDLHFLSFKRKGENIEGSLS